MAKFIPNSLLDFLTERIAFCASCIPGLEGLPLSKNENSDQITEALDKFKKTYAELELAKNWILNGDPFDRKKGDYIAKRFLTECLFSQEITLHGSRSFLTSDQIRDTTNHVYALRRIIAANQ